MKRKIGVCWAMAILVGLIFAGSLFTFQTVVAAEKPVLRVWFFKSFYAARNEAYMAQVQEFAKQKGIDVDVYFFTDAEYKIKLTSAVMAGAPPDVSEMLHEGPPRFHGMGELADITEVAKEVDKDLGIFPMFLAGVKYDGKFWALPKCHHPHVWFVRTDILKEAGAKEPETWQEVYEAAVKIRDKVKGIFPIGATFNRSTDGDSLAMTLLYSHGGSLCKSDGKTVAFDSPNTLAAVKMMEKMMEPGLQPPGVMAWTDPHNNEAWVAGKIAMTLNSVTIYMKLKQDKNPILENTKMLAMPAGPAGRATLANTLYLGVFKKGKNPELGKELIRYLMKPENQFAWMEASEGQASPISRKGVEHKFSWYIPAYENAQKGAEIAKNHGYPGPVTRAAVEVSAQWVLPDMAAQVIVGKVPPKKAIEEATKTIKEIYSKF
jgi:multiple sugar transport system substrate-binding protein